MIDPLEAMMVFPLLALALAAPLLPRWPPMPGRPTPFIAQRVPIQEQPLIRGSSILTVKNNGG